MGYEKKEGEYKESENEEKKYYFVGERKDEENKEEVKLDYDQLLRNIPKGGSIAAMPAYYGGVVYFPSLDTYFYALNAKTGKLVWKFKMGDVSVSGPLVHNKRIYFGSHDGYFYCMDLAGKLLWKKYLGDIVVSYTTGIGNKIFTAAGKIFYCLSDEGKELWRFMTGDGIFTSPTAVNSKLFISSFDKHVYALEPETGKMIWKFIAGGSITTPLVCADGKPVFTLSERSKEKIPEAKNPVLYSTSTDNNLYALSENGEVLNKFNCGGSFATIVNTDGKALYTGTAAGYFYALDMNLNPKWKFRAGGMITAGPAIHENKIYVSCWDQKLYCLSDKGEKLWEFLTGGPIAAEPIFVDDKVYFGSADTFFYCINAKNRTVEWTFQCGFGLSDELKAKIKDVLNTMSEYDKKVFKIWMPETSSGKQQLGGSLQNYQAPEGFSFGGEEVYKSSTGAYKTDLSYFGKKKPYKK